VVWFGKRKI
jgi:hypothetical protein